MSLNKEVRESGGNLRMGAEGLRESKCKEEYGIP